MPITIPKITPQQFITPELTQAVNAYLLARTYAEVKRQQVDKIQRQVLGEIELIATLQTRSPRAQDEKPFRINDPKDLFLCEDDEACKKYYLECSNRERAAGIKPADIPDEHCPALVAEHLQTQAEWVLLDISGKPFGIDSETPWPHPYLENRQKWINLVTKMVVNSPGYTG